MSKRNRVNRSSKEIFEVVVRECEKHGLPRPRLEMGGKHPRAIVSVDGQERFIVFGGSPSDRRVHLAKALDVRRVIREVRGTV